MNALRLVRNPRAVVKLAPKRTKVWPNNLPPPVHVADTEAIARAKSLLVADFGFVELTAAQAHDVCRWARCGHST